MNRVDCAINCKKAPKGIPINDWTNHRIGVKQKELYVMRRVMKETDGGGGPWFRSYSIRGGLFE